MLTTPLEPELVDEDDVIRLGDGQHGRVGGEHHVRHRVRLGARLRARQAARVECHERESEPAATRAWPCRRKRQRRRTAGLTGPGRHQQPPPMPPRARPRHARTLSAGRVENLSLRSPSSSNKCTTLSTVTTARRVLFGEKHMAVTLHIPSAGGMSVLRCLSFMATPRAPGRVPPSQSQAATDLVQSRDVALCRVWRFSILTQAP